MLAIITAIEDAYEREFISEIYTKYYKVMYAKAYSLTRSEFEAEEIVQEAFIKFIEHIDLLMSFDKNKIQVYIMVTTKNIAIKHWRRNKKRAESDDFVSEESFSGWLSDKMALPEDLYIRKEELAELAETINKLSEKDRILLESKYILMLSDKEIAEELNIAPSSVRSCLTRARRKAYTILKGESEDV